MAIIKAGDYPLRDKIGRILSRWRDKMPQYYRHDDWVGLRIRVRPLGWRRLFRFRRWYVGQRVKFHVEVKRLHDEAHPLTNVAVWERLPGEGAPRRLTPFFAQTLEIMEPEQYVTNSSILPRQGDVEYFLGVAAMLTAKKILVTAEVISPDKRTYDLFLVAIGVLLAVAAAILAVWLGLM